jgi:(2R)-3-sulfolactate dehydrogenase (NADP+)
MFRPEDAARPQRIGHLVVTLDPRRLDVEGGNGAQARFDELARRVEDAGGRLPGSRRTLPDEIDMGAPLPLARQLEDELAAWAERLGVRRRN